jgi:hypothetical protein
MGVFALLRVGGGALVWTFSVSPVLAGEQYYVAIRKQDYATAYTSLGVGLKATLSQQAFTRRARQQDAVEGRITHYTENNFL